MAAPDPSYELQRAVYAALVGAGVCGGAIFHRVPPQQPFPFCYIGEDSFEDGEGGPHTRATVNVSIFTATRPQAKQQLALARPALDANLVVTGFLCVEPIFEEARFIREPDGLSEHCLLTFSYLLIPTT